MLIYSMTIDYFNFFKEDAPIAYTLIAIILVSTKFGAPWLSILLIIIFIIEIWFYRSPIITIPKYLLQSNELYSPAYGTVESIQHIDNKYKIEIYLSLFDIHVQYFPTSGNVIHQEFLPMSVTTTMENLMYGSPNKDKQIIITQRIGYIARRISTPYKRGSVHAGDRLGIIKLGSHVDLIVSDKYKLFIKPGDTLSGPYTLIGVW
jgi:phosphatidylserine decarboxylase precursor-related protein